MQELKLKLMSYSARRLFLMQTDVSECKYTSKLLKLFLDLMRYLILKNSYSDLLRLKHKHGSKASLQLCLITPVSELMSLKVFCLSSACHKGNTALQGQQADKAIASPCLFKTCRGNQLLAGTSSVSRKLTGLLKPGLSFWGRKKHTLFAHPAFLIIALWLLLIFAFWAH